MKQFSKNIERLFSAYTFRTHISEGAVTPHKLKENSDDRLEKLRKRGEKPMICYEVATHVARAGNTISKQVEMALKAEKNYSNHYLALMDISDSTSRHHFDSNEIRESSFLNFSCSNHGMQHTVYIHKGPDGTLTLIHNNNLLLDRELSLINCQLECRGGANIYDITTGCDTAINRYMTKNSLVVYFTPASQINAKF